jgi:serine protease Do
MRNRIVLTGLCVALAGVGGFTASRTFVFATPAPLPAVKELPSYREIVKQVLPGVVTIEAKPKISVSKTKLPSKAQMPFGNIPGLPDELRKEFERYSQMPFEMPEQSPGRAMGSGFIIDPSGLIITNDHVVRNADEVQVLLHDGRKFTSRDIKRDPRSDLAIIRITAPSALPFLKLGDSDAMEVGDRVLAIGSPLGMTGTVTSGIISAKGRDLHSNMYEDFLQTDAAINPGNSGGPLVNLAGEVVGVNSAIKSSTGGFQGIGLAIASNLVKNVEDQLQKSGSVVRGYMGVQVGPLNADVSGRLGLKDKSGVVVAKVMPNSPAQKSGLEEGDILTDVNGQAVKDPRSLQRTVAGLTIGKKVELVVLRDGQRKTLTMTVENQPDSFNVSSDTAPPAHRSKLGIQVENLTPKTASQFGYAEKTQGVLITDVDADSVAGRAGLDSGMVILKVDGKAVRTVTDFESAAEKGSLAKGLLFQVKSPQGGTTYVLLKAAAG